MYMCVANENIPSLGYGNTYTGEINLQLQNRWTSRKISI